MYSSLDDWYSWDYNNQKFQTNYMPYIGQVGTFKEELIKAASSTIDLFGSDVSILFSGGSESDLMLRSFLAIKSKPNVYIVRYENDYNLYDVSYAVTICSMLNVDYKIIDFNLTHFFENDAEEVSRIAEIDRPRALPYCKILELIDGVPVFGRGEPNPIKLENNWIQRCHEYDVGRIKYARAINKPAIAEWFKWTPGLVISYMNLKWFNDLINDKYNAVDSSTTKMIGYREAYPELIDRVKKTGFEKIDTLINEVDRHLFNKYGGYPYRGMHDRNINDWYSKITDKNMSS
jgi:hypothetical protein